MLSQFRIQIFSKLSPVRWSSTIIGYPVKKMEPLEEEGKELTKKMRWLTYNDLIFPPQVPGENPRPAYICLVKENIKYSPKKMWYIACLVRGMSVDEAIRQLSFVSRKGAEIAKETIKEAQSLAIQDHNVEYKSNLWVAESFVGKGPVVHGIRRHARMRIGKVEYKHCHYFVRLEEGKPPDNYYNRPSFDKQSMVDRWMKMIRNRKISSSL